MLRKIRISLAVLLWASITLLFLDVSGAVSAWLGWTAKIHFIPAVLALNMGVVIALVVLTLLLGRVYCSAVCPLGVMQDGIAWLGRRGRKRHFPYSYSPAVSWLRWSVFVIFVVALLAGIPPIYVLLEPYSAYGRIASSILAPVYAWFNNNLFAAWAEGHDSYVFSRTFIIFRGITFIVAVVTLLAVGVLAWRGGRTYCNTVCPVGTLLGFMSRFSWLKPVIDTTKCNSCTLCSRRCKASCIDAKNHTIDYSRCVACMDCIDVCTHDAISYAHPSSSLSGSESDATGRRKFLTGLGIVAGASIAKAEDKIFDGGLAKLEDKKVAQRAIRVIPPGALSLRHFSQHCTACQLCVTECPSKVLRPSMDLSTFMQPEEGFEYGFCRPECVKCAEVCPNGAIKPVTVAEKSSLQRGHAVWIKDNCVAVTDGVSCGLCGRRCPAGAITMVNLDSGDELSPLVPAVDEERCIGCGACEHYCPARPLSAIYVEGVERQRLV